MNRKDITAALESGTELALHRGGSISQDWIGQQRLDRAQVLEVRPGGAPGTSELRYSDRQRAEKRSVHVRLVEPDAGTAHVERWVEPRELLATWPDYVAARAEHARLTEQAAETKAAKDAQRRAHAAELEALLAEHGLADARVKGTPEFYALEVTTATVTLTLAELRELVAAARALTPTEA